MNLRLLPAMLLGAAAIALPWLVDSYVIALAAQAAAFATLVLSVHVHTGLAGLPTLGQGAYLGLGAYTAANLARELQAPAPLLLAAAVAAAAALAALTGVAVVRTRGVVTVMLTLAVAELAHTTATRWTAVTGGSDGMAMPATPLWPAGPPLVLDGHVYLWLLAVSVLAYISIQAVSRSPYGRALTGIADQERRMRAIGYPVGCLLWTAHVWAGGLAGLAGGMWVAAHRYISPADAGLAVSALALLAAVIGGTGSATGAVAGAVSVVAVQDLAGQALTGAWAGHGPLLLGVLFIASVYLMPGGLVRLRLRRWDRGDRADGGGGLAGGRGA